MNIAEKLVTVAENVPKVFNAGQLSVISQSEALKGSAQGEGVTIKDISPVEHDVSVKLSGLPPVEADGTTIALPTPTNYDDGVMKCTVDNGTITIEVNGARCQNTANYYIAENLVLPAGKYVLSGIQSVAITDDIRGMWTHNITIFNSDNGNQIASWEFPKDAEEPVTNKTFTLDEETKIGLAYNYSSANIGETSKVVTVIKPQLKADVTYISADYSGVKVQRLGKNLFNGELTIWRNADRIMPKKCIKVKPNTWYTLSMLDYTIKNAQFAFYGNHTGVIGDGVDTGIASNYPRSFNSGEFEYIWFRQWQTMTECGNTLQSRMQFEEGQNTATEYEPYNSTEYTANADGTVEGIKSLYPTTTLMTDTEGVIVSAEYIKDIDKTFNTLITNLALTGGN